MPVIKDGKKIIPAPFVSIRKEPVTAGQERVGTTTSIVLKGKLVSYKGSPDSSKTWWTASGYPPDETLTDAQRLKSILNKQEALAALFAEDGGTLEIQPWDGSAPKKFNPRVRGVEFPEGNWVETCEYTITLEADDPADVGGHVLEASEDWNIEPADDKGQTFRLTHACSAVGKKQFDENGSVVARGWENARAYVLDVIGLGLTPARMEAVGVLDASALQAFNYVRTQQLNELTGSFQVTETWLCYDPGDDDPATDDYTVETRVDESGRTSVTVQGTLTGLETRDNNNRALIATRYANAVGKWGSVVQPAMFTRAENISGATLNPVPLGRTVGRNELAGTITYSYSYDDRPVPVIGLAKSQHITISNTNAADVFATIPIIGRAAGPLLQSIGTRTAKKRNINIEVVMPVRTMTFTPTAPNTDAVVAALVPAAVQVFMEQDEETWDEYTGRYTRVTSFVWQ